MQVGATTVSNRNNRENNVQHCSSIAAACKQRPTLQSVESTGLLDLRQAFLKCWIRFLDFSPL